MIVDGILSKAGIKIGPTEKKVILVGEIVAVIWGARKLHAMQEEKRKKKEQEALMKKYQEMQMMQMMQGGTAPGAAPGPGMPTFNGGGLSFAPTTYSNLADALEAAMNTSGTDETSVKDTMKKLKTLDDYNALDTAFGERQNYVFGIPAYTANMAYWISDEMGGSSELKEINAYFSQKQIPIVL